MKKLITILMLGVLTVGIYAQDDSHQQQRFSPERFEAQLQDYITKEAKLTPQEAAKFFPVYKEMQEKQRVVFERQRDLAKTKPADEEGCMKVIKESDEIELELKRIQQTYHGKFLKQLPASKVYDILKAEQRFLRRTMKNWGRGSNTGQWGQGFRPQGFGPQGGVPGFGPQGGVPGFGPQGFGPQGFRQQGNAPKRGEQRKP